MMIYDMTLPRILLCLFSLAALGTGEAEKRPLVHSQYGALRGVTLPVKETQRTVDAFFAVPFAKPPVGPLRFKRPEAPEPWKSVRDASQYPPMCLQYSRINKESVKLYRTSFKVPPVSEDCLYLNVFTPSDRRKGLKLPVMVFIHGGGLVFWSASYFDGSALSAYEDVVVVSIQYRMGVMGFLSSGDEKLRGNLGMFDQVAALQWVQENIADFGGDPQSVTIFGESAGGTSVAAHVLSPLSKGLFHRAIAQSGEMLMPGLVASNPDVPIMLRDMVAKASGCEPSSVVDCLMLKSEQEMLDLLESLQFFPLPIGVDGDFLPKLPVEILANNESNKVPLLMGVCEQEMGHFLQGLFGIDGVAEGMSRESIAEKLPNIPIMELKASMVPPILEEYLADASDPIQLRDRFLEITGDRLFVIPALRTAKYHRDLGHPTYFYQLQQPPSFLAEIRPAYVKTDHTDDLLYVFGGPFLRDGVVFAGGATDAEKLLARTMMRYWANFARNGNPNGAGLAKWPAYDAEERYLGIGLEQRVSRRLKEREYKFWTEIFPEKIEQGQRSDL